MIAIQDVHTAEHKVFNGARVMEFSFHLPNNFPTRQTHNHHQKYNIAACARNNFTFVSTLFQRISPKTKRKEGDKRVAYMHHANCKMLHAKACVVGKCCDLAPLRLV
jgi:hypothetical protein